MPLLLAACFAGSFGCSSGAAGEGSDVNASFPTAPLTTSQSDGAGFSVEVRTAPDQPPNHGVIAVEYRVTGPDGAPADGLALSVVPWMPEMQHGASLTPVVTAKGSGRYVLTNVEVFMAGTWELRTAIAGPSEDSVAPALSVQ